MDKATGSGSAPRNGTNTKEGTLIKGQDFIRLEATKVLLSKDTPLLTDAQDVAGAINELFSGGGEGSDEDTYQPPEMPEPTDYEMYFLVEVVKNSSSENVSVDFEILMTYAHFDENDNYWYTTDGVGSLTIDWGDGTVSSADGYDIEAYEAGSFVGNGWYDDKYQDIRKHTYTAPGRYLIKCTCTKYSNFLNILSFPYKVENGDIFTVAIKLGSEAIVTPPYIEGVTNGLAQNAFMGQPHLEYIKFNGKNGLPLRGFESDYNLRRVDISEPPTVLTYEKTGYIFQTLLRTYNLRKFDMSKIVSLKDQNNSNCGLEELYLPLCTEMSENPHFNNSYRLQKISLPIFEGDIPASFASGCYSLEEIKMPEIKKIGAYAFSTCFKLSEIDILSCTEIGKSAFNNCVSLTEVYAPNCTYIDDRAFEYCYSLKKITVAEGCTFGSNCFANCESLFPRPDGSEN